eukprot:5760064-Pyramimonas_sp.AAC.1
MEPCSICTMHCMEPPTHGGDTLFASGVTAYDVLPEGLKHAARCAEVVSCPPPALPLEAVPMSPDGLRVQSNAPTFKINPPRGKVCGWM